MEKKKRIFSIGNRKSSRSEPPLQGIFPMEWEVGVASQWNWDPNTGIPIPKYHSHKTPLRYGNGMGKIIGRGFHYAWRIIPVLKWLIPPIYKP